MYERPAPVSVERAGFASVHVFSASPSLHLECVFRTGRKNRYAPGQHVRVRGRNPTSRLFKRRFGFLLAGHAADDITTAQTNTSRCCSIRKSTALSAIKLRVRTTPAVAKYHDTVLGTDVVGTTARKLTSRKIRVANNCPSYNPKRTGNVDGSE